MSRPPAPRWFLGLVAASVTMVAGTAALGPSAAVPPLPGDRLGPLPPYFGNARPAAVVVTALLAAAVLAGVAGLLGLLRALRGGWAPNPRRLLAAGLLAVAALAVLPPVGSGDPKSYAAYGRMAAIGLDPYATTPTQLADRGDPVGVAVERPWRHSPSVYGPLATAEQTLVSRLAVDSTRAAVGLLGLLNALAYAATALLLHRRARTPAAQRRTAVLWALNPLLLLQVVAGAHLDALVVLGVVAAVVLRPGPLAGAAAGAAVAVKLPAAAVGLGLAWAARRLPGRLVAIAAGGAVVLSPAYVLAGPHVLDQLRKAASFVSLATPWRPLAEVLDAHYGETTSRRIIGVAALVVAALLALLLARALPPGQPVVRVTLAVTLAYVLVTPYALPWYDAAAWALLALLPACRYDALLAAHTGVLSLAYLPGRVVPLPDGLAGVTTAVRGDVGPWALLAVIAVAFTIAARRPATSAA